AQGPQAVDRLQRGDDDEAEAENAERAQQGAAQDADLLIEDVAILRDLEAPAHRRAGQPRLALDHPQFLAVELVAVVEVDAAVRIGRADLEAAIPQRTRREGIVAVAADLVVETGIGLEETLVGG